jgi:hypothetical protein
LHNQKNVIQESSAGALGVLYLFMPGAKCESRDLGAREPFAPTFSVVPCCPYSTVIHEFATEVKKNPDRTIVLVGETVEAAKKSKETSDPTRRPRSSVLDAAA